MAESSKSLSSDFVFEATPGSHADRVMGCLLGGAVGDAFGYAVEFSSLSVIRERFGPDGIREPMLDDDRLVVSDDTQMTLFTLEGLLRAFGRNEAPETDLAVEQIRLAYIDWLATQGETCIGWRPAGHLHNAAVMKARRAPGNTCLSALRAQGRGTPSQAINNSKGCGGVMRVAPIGLVQEWSPEQAFDVAARAAAATHGHPSGYLSAAAMAMMIRLMLDGASLQEVPISVLDVLASHRGSAETIASINAALTAVGSLPADHTDAVAGLGEGWVGEEALSVALYAALAGNSFPEVLAIGANHDGDSDSTASIAGQLFGAWRGLSDLPQDWVTALDVRDPMVGLLVEFLR